MLESKAPGKTYRALRGYCPRCARVRLSSGISEVAFPGQPPEGKMEAYRIDRFGSIDGIVLRSSVDPGPGRGDPDACARQLA